jgi:G:T-mismatch repair DNA endonuclease (very short patch repair protein)
MTKNAWRFPEIRRKFAESGNVFISQHPAWNKGMKCPYAGEKFKDAAFLSRLIRGRRKRPTAPEATFIKIIEDNGLPFEYTGNGQLIIGGKNPDFSDHNGHLVEIFGVYWHDPSEVQARINHYQGHGWKTLVLWENDLKDVPDVIERVKRFVYD